MAHQTIVTTTFLLFGLWGTAPAFAAETAEVRGSFTTETSPPVAGRLGKSDAARLFAGEIPSLSHVSRKYGRGRHLDVCTSKFKKLLGKDVTPIPVRANHATILANARALGLSAKKVNKALAVFLKNQDQLPNQRYVSVIDFDRPVSQKRLFTIDLRTGRIEGFLTSAGRGSDPDGDGYATMFSNQDKTHATSLGCYTAYGFYNGTNGHSMVLNGMESTNDNACDRSIVMHAADYIGQKGNSARSWGCPAVRSGDRDEIFKRVNGGIICAEREGKWAAATKIFSSKKYGRRGRNQWKKSRKHQSRKYLSRKHRRRHHAY